MLTAVLITSLLAVNWQLTLFPNVSLQLGEHAERCMNQLIGFHLVILHFAQNTSLYFITALLCNCSCYYQQIICGGWWWHGPEREQHYTALFRLAEWFAVLAALSSPCQHCRICRPAKPSSSGSRQHQTASDSIRQHQTAPHSTRQQQTESDSTRQYQAS